MGALSSVDAAEDEVILNRSSLLERGREGERERERESPCDFETSGFGLRLGDSGWMLPDRRLPDGGFYFVRVMKLCSM